METSHGEAPIVDYDAMAASYQARLTSVLRNFTAGSFDFLSTWIHDADDARSLLGILEAARASGLPAIAVDLGVETAQRLDRAHLDERASALGRVSWEKAPAGGSRLRVAFSGHGALAGASSVRAGAVYGASSRPRAAWTSPEERIARALAGRDCDAIGPVYRPAIERRVARLAHEGPLPAAREGQRAVAAAESVLHVQLLVDGKHVVTRACHSGGRTPVERALLEALCEVVEGRPILECGDHAAIRVEHLLRDGGARPVPGIVQPENADPAFIPIVRIARALLESYRQTAGFETTENFFDERPARAFLSKPDVEKVQAVQIALDEAVVGAGRSAGEVECDRVEPTGRVALRVAPSVPASTKPRLLMQLEAALKRRVDPALHVSLQERKDLNSIRRTIS
ncbi:MAG TPA: hypothetical protein VFF73_32980 [Planctomycetota bacterium]|nr:hypothetical protein [Planctomycetota bacterium]